MPELRKGGSAPEGGAHSTICFAYTAGETLENMFFTNNLLLVWQSTPKVVPRSRISRSAAPFSYPRRFLRGKQRGPNPEADLLPNLAVGVEAPKERTRTVLCRQSGLDISGERDEHDLCQDGCLACARACARRARAHARARARSRTRARTRSRTRSRTAPPPTRRTPRTASRAWGTPRSAHARARPLAVETAEEGRGMGAAERRFPCGWRRSR